MDEWTDVEEYNKIKTRCERGLLHRVVKDHYVDSPAVVASEAGAAAAGLTDTHFSLVVVVVVAASVATSGFSSPGFADSSSLSALSSASSTEASDEEEDGTAVSDSDVDDVGGAAGVVLRELDLDFPEAGV